MKAESNIIPVARFEILPLNDEEVEVLFYENIENISGINEETKKYCYDYYRLIVRNRDNLNSMIESFFEDWLEFAKIKESKESIRMPNSEDRLVALEETMNFILGL